MNLGSIGYQVELEQFEGPLALLLYLIRKEEIDIYDIPIQRITQQYLDYIKKMKELDLEVAGEFVAMAATLIHIKSRMLLPTYDENGEVVEVEDPRKELVQKLLEYQKYQEAAQKLYERPLKGRDFWLRGIREEIEDDREEEILLEEENALFALISEYRKVIRNQKTNVHKVGQKEQSIAHRITEIRNLLNPGERTTLWQILDNETGEKKLLITFLSLLELGKMGFVSLFQSEPYADIHIDAKKEIDNDAISNVEEYDAAAAEAVAEQLMSGDVSELIEENEELPEEPEHVVLDEPVIEEDMATDEEILLEEARIASEVDLHE
jgi:segregation and condensation protein A